MGDLGLLSFQIGGDIAEYTKSMNAAKQQAQELQSMLQNKAKDISMNINTDSFNAAAQASQRMGETMSQSMRGAGESVKNLQRTLKQLEELYDRLPNKESTSGKSLLDNINKLKTEISSISQGNGNMLNLGGEESIKRMEDSLRKMTDQYKLLSSEERKSTVGTSLAENIRVATSEINILKSDLSNVKFTGAEDSIKSIKNGLTELRSQYERLSESERNSPMGTNMLESIKNQEAALQNMTHSLNQVKKGSLVGDEDSYNRIKKSISDMTEEYNKMSESERRSDNGVTLSNNIRKAKEELNSIKANLSTVNKESPTISPTSYIGVEQSLKRMINDYKMLSSEERNSPIGLNMEKNIRAANVQLNEMAAKMKMLRATDFGGTNSIKSMESSLMGMVNQYKMLSDVERKSQVGVDLSSRIRNTTTELKSATSSLSPNIENSNSALDKHYGLLNYIWRRAISYLAIWQSGRLISSLMEVTGEFEKQKVALGSMLQNTVFADQLFSKLKSFAVVSPFNFIELTGQVKQLAAYSIPASQLFDTLKRIGDVASGTGSDMGRLVYALGEVNTQTVLNGRVLRQFTTAGVPLVDELAKHYSKLTGTVVRAGDVFDMVSKKQVSFGDVMSVIKDMTSQGGMFYNMQGKQAETLAGKLSNLKDKWDIFLSDLGENGRGVLVGAVDSVSSMLQHWQATLTVIKSIVLAFGEYKAAIMIANLLSKQQLATDAADLAIQKARGVAASSANGVASGATSAAAGGWIGLGLATITLVIGALQAYKANQQAVEDEMFKTVKQTDDETDANNNLIDRLKVLSSASSDNAGASAERQQILEKLSQTEPILSKEIEKHTNNLKELIKAQLEYNSIQDTKKGMTFAENQPVLGSDKSIIESTNNAEEAKRKLEKSNSELEISYNRIFNSIKQFEENGFKTGGIEQFSDKTISTFSKITDGSGTVIEKMNKIREVINDLLLSQGHSGNIDISGYFKDAVTSSVEYNRSIEKNIEAQRGLNYDTKQYGEYLKALAKFNNIDINTEQGKKHLSELIKEREGLSDKVKTTLVQYLKLKWQPDDPMGQLEGWRKDLQSWLGANTLVITAEDNMDDVIKNAQTKYKQLKENLENTTPILIKANVDLKLPIKDQLTQIGNNSLLSPWQKSYATQNAKDRDEYTKEQKALQDFFAKTGTPSVAPTSKTKTNVEDRRVKQWLLEKQAIDDVRSSYSKLIEIESRENVIKDLRKNKVIGKDFNEGLFSNGLDDSGYENYLKNLENKIKGEYSRVKNVNKEQLKSALNEVSKALINARTEIASQVAKTNIQNIEDVLSNNKPKYNLYKNILGITGDKSQAISLAGFDTSSFKDQIDFYKDQISSYLKKTNSKLSVTDLLGFNSTQSKQNNIPEGIQGIVTETNSLIDEQKQSIVSEALNVISQYGTIEKKIEIVKNKANELKEKVRSSNIFSPDELKSFFDSVDSQTTDSINGLEEKSLELTPFYQKLFGDISQYSHGTLVKLMNETKSTIEAIQKTGTLDKGGKMSYSYTYTDKSGKDKTQTVTQENLTRMLKQYGIIAKDIEKTDPFKLFLKGVDELGGKDKSQGIKDIAESINYVSSQAGEAASSLGNMFSSLGDEDTATTMNEISGIASGIGSAVQGIASMNPAQVISGITGIVSSIANAHDSRLTKAINNSKIAVQELKNEYEDLERVIKRQLGEITEDQSSQLLGNYKEQLSELETQLTDERQKKKKDKSAIVSLEEEITVLKDEIDNYYEDLMSSEYSISIKDMASQIADSLVSAFASGESAAAAFDNTVAQIMQNVIKNIISVNIVEPALQKLKNYLFGDTGVANDGTLSTSDVSGMVKYIADVQSAVTSSSAVWDAVKQAAAESGINLSSTSTSSSGISASEQSLTENTGNILAGYIDNIRLDVAAISVKYDNLIVEIQSYSTTFSSMLTQLTEIKTNTEQIVTNTKAMGDLYDFVKNKLTIKNSGYGLNIN